MKLFRRDSEANVIEMGTVEFIDGKLKFSGFKDSFLLKWLQGGVWFGGELLSGKALFDKLPLVLSGDRLWAVP